MSFAMTKTKLESLKRNFFSLRQGIWQINLSSLEKELIEEMFSVWSF